MNLLLLCLNSSILRTNVKYNTSFDEPPIAVSKLLNLAVHSKVWPVGMIARCSTIGIHYSTGLFIPKKYLSLFFYGNRNLKISKSKKSEQYFRDKIEIFIPLFDEHFAHHFESHWRETWHHTGRRTIPQISSETPFPLPRPLAGPIFSVFFLTITDGERALVYRGSLYPPGMLVYFTLGFTFSAFPSFPRHLTQISTQSVSQYSCMKLTPNLLTQRLVLNQMKLVLCTITSLKPQFLNVPDYVRFPTFDYVPNCESSIVFEYRTQSKSIERLE